MFLRRHRVVDEVSYEYCTSCESQRTANEPRQRIVAPPGKLDSADFADDAGWDDLTALLKENRVSLTASPARGRPLRASAR